MLHFIFGIFTAVIAPPTAEYINSHVEQLPTCEEMRATNPGVYRLQHDPDRTGAPALKTCR